MASGMRPLPLQGRHCCILSLILRPPPPTLSTKPRPPHSWHGTSTETVSSTEVRSLPVIPACSAGMPSPLTGPRPRPPSVHRSVTAAVARPCPWLRPHYRTHRSRRSNGSVAPPAGPLVDAIQDCLADMVLGHRVRSWCERRAPRKRLDSSRSKPAAFTASSRPRARGCRWARSPRRARAVMPTQTSAHQMLDQLRQRQGTPGGARSRRS
jgi:hypothetical protein